MDETPETLRAPQPADRQPGFEALVRRIAEGSETAVWELIDRYGKNILRVVRRHLSPDLRTKVDSIDVCQSVWKSLLRKGEGFDHIKSAEEFVAYIAGVARNKALEKNRAFLEYQRRDVQRDRPFPGQSHADPRTPELHDPKALDPMHVARARDSWEQAVRAAGKHGRRVVELRLQGLKYSEIASEIGLSEITARRSVASIISSLK